jgi:hypothetical protein
MQTMTMSILRLGGEMAGAQLVHDWCTTGEPARDIGSGRAVADERKASDVIGFISLVYAPRRGF